MHRHVRGRMRRRPDQPTLPELTFQISGWWVVHVVVVLRQRAVDGRQPYLLMTCAAMADFTFAMDDRTVCVCVLCRVTCDRHASTCTSTSDLRPCSLLFFIWRRGAICERACGVTTGMCVECACWLLRLGGSIRKDPVVSLRNARLRFKRKKKRIVTFDFDYSCFHSLLA